MTQKPYFRFAQAATATTQKKFTLRFMARGKTNESTCPNHHANFGFAFRPGFRGFRLFSCCSSAPNPPSGGLMVKKTKGNFAAFAALLGPWVLAGLVIGLIPGYQLYRYVWTDSRFCSSCHVHDYATVGWENSGHSALTTCRDCHQQSLRDMARQALTFVTTHPQLPKDLKTLPEVSENKCTTCHIRQPKQQSLIGPLAHSRETFENVPKVDELYLHQRHLNANRKITCSNCHLRQANRAHNMTVADQSCIRCHSVVHHTEVGRDFGCRGCHFQDFLTPVVALDTTATKAVKK